jgi:imidazolonepropionase-like amidohydrolase
MELVISAGQILTGPAGERIEDGSVLVREGTIAAVGIRDQVHGLASPTAMSLSVPNGTVLPGLIDAHVHLAFDAGPDPVGALRASNDRELLLGMAGRARQLLDSGVTTVRDLGDRNGLAIQLGKAIDAGMLPGPRILAAGTPLTVPGGHCWFLGGEVDDDDSIRALIRRNVELGAKVIQVMATDGGLAPGGPAIRQTQFTSAQFKVIMQEARRAGLPVAAHAHGTEGIAAAVEAGVDTIEHCTWMADGGFEVRDDLVVQIAAKGIRVCPAASPNWRAFAERFGAERAGEVFGPFRWMDERGVQLITGTDAGVPSAVFNDFVSSLEFFEYLGLSRERILEMATISTAEALGVGDDTARIAPGYRADLLLVEGDPLEDLDALRHLRIVTAGGRAHVRRNGALRALTA